MAPGGQRLWSARLAAGRSLQGVEIPHGHVLRITRACPTNDPIGSIEGRYAWIEIERSRASGPQQSFLVPSGGVALPIQLACTAAAACVLRVRGVFGAAAVDLIGYTQPRRGLSSRLSVRSKFKGRRTASRPQTVHLPAGSKTVVEVQPPRPAAYNPLRPAASNAAAAPVLAPGAKARAAALATRVAVVKTSTVSSFSCDDRILGTGGTAVREGQSALLRFSIRTQKDEKKVVERGEIWCRLGDAEVVDGWVDGNVDMEAVLAKWSRAVVGMRVGGARRVRVPKAKSFKGESGGEGAAGDLFFDVELKQTKS